MNKQSIAILSDRLFSNPGAAIYQAKKDDWGIDQKILDTTKSILVKDENTTALLSSDPLKYINEKKLETLINAYKEINTTEANVMSDALRWSYNMRTR